MFCLTPLRIILTLLFNDQLENYVLLVVSNLFWNLLNNEISGRDDRLIFDAKIIVIYYRVFNFS